MACRDIVKAKPAVNNSETGDSHATNCQGMHCFRVFALFSLLNLEISCFFDFCKCPLSTFKLFYHFFF